MRLRDRLQKDVHNMDNQVATPAIIAIPEDIKLQSIAKIAVIIERQLSLPVGDN